MHTTGLAADPVVKEHDPGPGHPEQVARYAAVMDRLAVSGLLESLTLLPVREASRDELELVHTPTYIDLAEREVAQHRRQLSTGDTAISTRSYDSALRAAGCVISAVDAVFNGQVTNAFCAVRPPGHHAGAGKGMAFASSIMSLSARAMPSNVMAPSVSLLSIGTSIMATEPRTFSTKTALFSSAARINRLGIRERGIVWNAARAPEPD